MQAPRTHPPLVTIYSRNPPASPQRRQCSSSQPHHPKKGLSLESHVNEATAGLFEFMKGGLSSAISFVLWYGAYFSTRLTVAITMKAGLMYGIIPGALTAGLVVCAFKCALIAYRQLKNGTVNFRASSSGLYRNYIKR